MSIDEVRPVAAVPASDATPTGDRRVWTAAPAFDAAAAGRASLCEGDRGPAVSRLQELLNAAGASPALEVDGKLGPATLRALLRFQRAHDLEDDGRAGQRTLTALTDPPAVGAARPTTAAGPTLPELVPPRGGGVLLQPPELVCRALDAGAFAPEAGRVTAPFGTDRATREQQAEAILRASGAWPPPAGELFVVHIDQDGPPPPTAVSAGLKGSLRLDARRRRAAEQRRVDRHLTRYTGETVVFRAQGGRLVEQNPAGPLRSASHPGQRATTASPDVDGDGVSDIATLRPGLYHYRGRLDADGRFDPVSDAAMKVARDVDHDGAISDAEARRELTGSGIQIHPGTSSGPVSIGCQTLPPEDFKTLERLVTRAKVRTFTYVLVRRPADPDPA